jgi:Spy/CpxP family protein refolding chaperone
MKLPVAVLSLVVLFLAVSLSLSDAQQRMRMTPEQRAARLKDSLALSDDQVGKLVPIFQDSDKLREDAFASAGDDRDARMAAMRKIMDETDTKIESVLTDTQKTKYEDMKKQRMQGGQGYQRRPQTN